MYICVCNAISTSDIEADPSLIYSCGTKCGSCIPYIKKGVYPGTTVPYDLAADILSDIKPITPSDTNPQ